MSFKFAATVILLIPVVLVIAWPGLIAAQLAPRLADAIAAPIDDAVAWARR